MTCDNERSYAAWQKLHHFDARSAGGCLLLTHRRHQIPRLRRPEVQALPQCFGRDRLLVAPPALRMFIPSARQPFAKARSAFVESAPSLLTLCGSAAIPGLLGNLEAIDHHGGVDRPVSLAEWKPEAISAVEHWLALQPGSSAQQRWKPIGSAEEGNEPGWLLLDKRGEPVKLDTLNDLCFAGEGGPDVDTAYPVETFRQVDGVLLLKEPAALPKRSRTVWSRSMSLRLLTEKLLSGLRESGNTPIADAFASRPSSASWRRSRRR